MTVAALTAAVSYSENGVTLNFAVPFRYLDPTHLVVTRTAADGTQTTLSYGTAWSATAGTTHAGGTLTLIATVAGCSLTIERRTPRAQSTDYVANDRFPAETHEATVDRAMLIDQEQDVDLTRAIRGPSGDKAIGRLPAAAARAGKYLGFDGTGNPIALAGVGAVPTLAQLMFQQAGLGAVLLDMLSKARQIVSVKDFGAVGDGVTDDTAAIKTAIDAAVLANKELYFPGGTYKVTARSTITLPNSAVGPSATNYFAQLRIRGDGFSNTIINCTASGWLRIVGSSQQHSFDIQDLTIAAGTAGGFNGIEVDCSAYPFFGEWTAPNRIKVHFRGNDGINNVKYWGTCFDGTDWSKIDFTGSIFDGASTPNGIGVALRASAGSYVCQFKFGVATSWRFLATAFKIGKGVQSIKMVAPFFAMCSNNVLVPAGLINLQDFQITNPVSFGHAAGDSFVFNSAYPNLVVTGGLVCIHDGNVGFKFTAHDMTLLQGIQFVPDTTPNGALSAIEVAGTAAGSLFMVDACMSASVSKLVDIKATASAVCVTGTNRCTSNMTLVADAGASSVIGHLVQSPAGKIGYGTGAGGNYVQATSKSTPVAATTPCGQVTTHNASLAGGLSVTFTINNPTFKAYDVVVPQWGNTNYLIEIFGIGAGSRDVRVTNKTGGALGDAVPFNFINLGGSNA